MRSFRTRLRAPSVAVCTAAFLMGSLGPMAHATGPADRHLTDYVDPFMGTQKEGNTYPGATVPFGMTQISPDTGHFTGYDHRADRIRGFSMDHLSGAGCGAEGDLPVLPTTGAVRSTDYARYAAAFTHAGEKASPGYYRVRLTSYGGITAELTATARTGRQRYTFPATTRANVLLNTGQALHKVITSAVRVVDDHTVATEITGRGFCADTLPYTVYSVTRFDRPFTAHGTWSGDTVTAGSASSTGAGRRGAYVRFDTTRDRTVTATTAISYVSAGGALRNLEREGHGTFGRTASAARHAWEERLERVRVHGHRERLRTFYSALYRALLAPNTGNDVDGRYTGWDGLVHRADGFTYYQNWSLWDTYRTQAQLLSLIAPHEMRDMAISLLKVNRQGGWLPKWGLATVETNTMTGDPITPFLVNAYHQGLLHGYEEEAYQALRRNADRVPPADSPLEGRGGNPRYLTDGFVPLNPHAKHRPGDFDYAHGPSVTLEYALADAALGMMAHTLGHEDDARRYLARSQNFRNVFDPRTRYFRARDARGLFTGPTDPKRSIGFHEGTAAQYMWLVPQDLPELIRMIGGRAATNHRLDTFFAYDRLRRDPRGTARDVWVHGPYAYYDQNTYNPQNEPDLLAPYTYLSTGQPWKTTDVVHAALTLYTDGPGGVPGNDDLGTMSSWAVLSSIGLFPIQSGVPTWGLTTPVFDRVDLTLDPRYYPAGHLTITAPGTSDSDRYIRSVRVGGHDLTDTWLTTGDLRTAGTVAFTVGRTPSGWGTRAQDAPPAYAGPRVPQHRLAQGATPDSVRVGRGGGARLTAFAVLTQPGQATARLTVSGQGPLRVEPRTRTVGARSNSLPATVAVPLRVSAPAGLRPGTHRFTIEVTDRYGGRVSRAVTVTVGR